jgi:hypothetical protein
MSTRVVSSVEKDGGDGSMSVHLGKEGRPGKIKTHIDMNTPQSILQWTIAFLTPTPVLHLYKYSGGWLPRHA